MGYKTISLSDEAYEKLASLKRNGESFTDVILRLCSKSPRKPLSSFAASWTMSDEEEKKIFREVAEAWRKYEESLLGHWFPSGVAERPA